MKWSSQEIAEELAYVQQWGKSTIWGVAQIHHTDKGGADLWSPCMWGTCQCPEDGFVYAWSCWCTEGEVSASWYGARQALEEHMKDGLHK